MSDLPSRISTASRLKGFFPPTLGRDLDGIRQVAGRRVVVIEDIVTTGGQLIRSIEDLRAEGALIGIAMCVIDREAGGAAHLVEAGVELRALFQMSELT